jgi:Fe-S cluster biogenesis protein NfuA
MTGSGGDSRPITLDEAEAVLGRWVRPTIQGHAGDIHVAEVTDDGEVKVVFSGACRCCPLQPVTLGTSVLPAFSGVEGVSRVTCESVRVSPHAMRRMALLMRPAIRTAENVES